MPNLIELQIDKEEKYYLICENCGDPLSIDNEYHQTWGTCDRNCYANLVGVNLHEF